MKKNITIKEVAKLSGYSTQTISRVINKDLKVKTETREKILRIIEECGYKPNFYAKSLVSKKNKNILILLKRKSGHKATIWTSTLVNEIILKNTRSDISILVEQYYKDEELEKSLLSKASTFIDGAIIFYEEKDDERIKLLEKNNIPFIIFGKSYDKKNIYVANDDFNSCYKATKYIIENIGEKIVFITGESLPMNEQRIEGIIKAYTEVNSDIQELKIERFINTSSEIKEIAKKYIYNLPECFFVNGDEKAIVLIRELFNNGIKVPNDVAV
ncbi:MAG: LacI family transcriptional regulator, partial [Fusobacterium mortiferum]|nr:LacI family transcriptional regulator [Fusobacterium mortiferum]